jgi:ferritin-like metal-binding protein YciE
MAIESMEDLLVHELRDLYNAEKQLLQALPKMAEKATDEELVTALERHLSQTEEQVSRLDECFGILGVSSRGKKCAGMEGLIEEATDLMEECDDDNVRDAAIIGAAQRVEHYEMSAYGTARAFAQELGHDEIVELLTTTLDEEADADELLSRIAESRVNVEAEAGSEVEEAEVGGKARGKGTGARTPASATAKPRRTTGSRRERAQ